MVIGIDDAALMIGGSAVAQGVASAFGGGLDFEENQSLMREANTFNQVEAEKARQFQERMSNSAYQRSRADMEKAGLNPMLMMQQGGASTPAGSSASAVKPPETHRMETALGGVLSSAREMMGTLAGLDKARADTREADTRAIVNEVMASKVAEDVKVSGASARKIEKEKELLDVQTQQRENDKWKAEKMKKLYDGVDYLIDRARNNKSSAREVPMKPGQMLY